MTEALKLLPLTIDEIATFTDFRLDYWRQLFNTDDKDACERQVTMAMDDLKPQGVFVSGGYGIGSWQIDQAVHQKADHLWPGLPVVSVNREISSTDLWAAAKSYLAGTFFGGNGLRNNRVIFTNRDSANFGNVLRGEGYSPKIRRHSIVLEGKTPWAVDQEIKAKLLPILASDWDTKKSEKTNDIVPVSPTVIEFVHKNFQPFWDLMRDPVTLEATAEGRQTLRGFDLATLVHPYKNARTPTEKSKLVGDIIQPLANGGKAVIIHASGNNAGHKLLIDAAKQAGVSFAETLFAHNHGGKIFDAAVTRLASKGIDASGFELAGVNNFTYGILPFIKENPHSLGCKLIESTVDAACYAAQLDPEQRRKLQGAFGRLDKIAGEIVSRIPANALLSNERTIIRRNPNGVAFG